MGLDKEQNAIIEELYRKMYKPLCMYAKEALDDLNAVEEVVQDTFRIACIKVDSLMASKNPDGWLVLTLKYVIRNWRKHDYRMSRLLIAALSVDDITVAAPVDEREFDIMYSDLFKGDDFTLMKMIVIYKFTMKEAADELGITVEACKKRMQRIKEDLENKFERFL